MVKWLSKKQIFERKKTLSEENSNSNREYSRYLRLYALDKKGLHFSIETKTLGHPLGSFEVKHKNWGGIDGLEKHYLDAGYYITKFKRKNE